MVNLEPECKFRTARSGGSGGQHVNKVETKVELIWQPATSRLLEASEKNRLLEQLAQKLDSDGLLHITAQESRSQVQNKAIALRKLHALVKEALFIPKLRKKKTMPANIKAAIKEGKAINAQKKATRRNPTRFDGEE